MKLNQNELIEFADEQNLEVFGEGNFINSKIRSIQRLIQKGLLPKPKWEGGKFPAYWKNDLEIKERIIWIDEKRKEGLSYRQMKVELESEKTPHPESRIIAELILEIEELLNISPGNSEVLFIKTLVLYHLERREESLKILHNLETNCNENKKLLFRVYEEITHLYHILNNKEKELKTCQKLISLAEEMVDKKKLGFAYITMGHCLALSYNDTDKAYNYFQSSVELLKGSSLVGDAYGSIFRIYAQKGNFAKAEEYLKKAIAIFIKSNDKRKECVCKANLGLLYYDSNRLSEAMKFMQKAYHIISQIHDLDSEAEIIGNIGLIYQKRGLFPKAIENFRHAYHIASQIRSPEMQKKWMQKMSEVYKEMGNLKKSEFFLKESKKIE
ncbi:MAG: tetratricopeptide repeat protein [Candidatus Cloacimonetes bacterium]|nr:tetratricopeptide repeat protein [Candidatus Cloacimonadota bacterium]